MNDRELLMMAAKAAGYQWRHEDGDLIAVFLCDRRWTFWDPMEDDGAALRLAVKLSIRVEPYTEVKIHDKYPAAKITDVYSTNYPEIQLSERHGDDPDAATRRAIVRAAAEIGKLLP